jgi:SAM-dependent methyltransferase
VNLTEYRASSLEQQRTADLLKLVPSGRTALDIGARDGHFSLLLAERFDRVIALDLIQPTIANPKVLCMQGSAASLELSDRSIDFVFCAEVLEHIPMPILTTVCNELERVANGQILIGVPYREDTRVGRTTCYSCMGKNPPWGHLNTFDEQRLIELFPSSRVVSVSFVGTNDGHTNALSSALMDLAGNPYGTYSQDEPCIHCGRALVLPPERNLAKKVLTRLAFWSRNTTGIFARPRANWIHMLLSRKADA